MKEINKKTGEWIKTYLLPELNEIIDELEIKGVWFNISPLDNQTIQVFYPQTFQEQSILQEVRLEIGALAAWTPVIDTIITPYIVKAFPQLFAEKSILVPTVEAKRTFWEKIIILHKMAHRQNNQTPNRYSRHYYDIYQLMTTEIKNEAFSDLELLQNVVNFNKKFYPSNIAILDEITLGKIKLIPKEEQLNKLRDDYKLMKNMIYGDYPSFDHIIEKLVMLEKEINNL